MGKKERQFEQSSEWLDWLSDTASTESTPEPPKKPAGPPYSSFRAYTPQQPTAAPTSPITHRREDDAVVINFHLPELHLPTVPWRKVLKISLIVGLVGLIIGVTPYVIKAMGGKGNSTATNSTNIQQQPAYAPLEPTTSSAATNHVQNVQYDSTKQLYKYNDTYEGVTLTVSQQPLPDDLRNNPDKLKALAASIGANEAVTTTNGTVYISTDANLTTQRLVFASKQILVFMQANGVLKNPEWVKYVQALQSKV